MLSVNYQCFHESVYLSRVGIDLCACSAFLRAWRFKSQLRSTEAALKLIFLATRAETWVSPKIEGVFPNFFATLKCFNENMAFGRPLFNQNLHAGTKPQREWSKPRGLAANPWALAGWTPLLEGWGACFLPLPWGVPRGFILGARKTRNVN